MNFIVTDRMIMLVICLIGGYYERRKRENGMTNQTAEKLPWQVDAICAQTDPEAFFPEKGGSPRKAIVLCRQVCTVREACLQDALNLEPSADRDGVRGGYSPRQRQRARLAGLTAAQLIALEVPRAA
jgi:hypothetical protein